MPASSDPPPRPRALLACTRAAFRTLVAIAIPGCLLTTLAYFTSTPAFFAQLSPFRVQYAVLLGTLALFALVLRKGRWALLFFAFAGFNVWAVLRSALPSAPIQADISGPTVKILLANVLTSNPDPAPLLALIATEKPDLIALLETNRRWQDQLSRALLPTYSHATFHAREDNFGLAVLSRILPSDTRVEFFADREIPSLAFTLSVDGRPLRVLLTHPLPPGDTEYTELRDRHLSELINWAATARQTPGMGTAPVLILGDLNSTPWCPPLRHLIASSGLRPALRGHAWVVPSWPAAVPFLRIPLDHALIDPALVCTSYHAGPNIGSDHFPVLLEVRFPRRVER